MKGTRKRLFASYAEAEQAFARTSRELGFYQMVLADAVENEIRWVERGNYRVGLGRLDGAAGGYALVRWIHPGQRPIVRFHLIDDLYRDHGPTSRSFKAWFGSSTHDQDAHDLAMLAAEAVRLRDEAVSRP